VRDPIRHRRRRGQLALDGAGEDPGLDERLYLVVRGKGVRVEAPGAID